MKDPKTQLQEYLQGQQRTLPSYEVSQTSGKSHEQVFTVICKLVDPEMSGKGSGSSRKQAEQQAAREILDRLEQ
jgi:ribonuclease-3